MPDCILRPLRIRGYWVYLARYAMTGVAAFLCALPPANSQTNDVSPAELKAAHETPEPAAAENWNWHVQNTDIVQGDSAFPAQYSGPNSLNSKGELRETVSLDLYAGARLWPGAE